MRIYWWQDGLHISPESQKEHDALAKVWRFLENLKIEFPDRSGTEFPRDSGISASSEGDD